MRNPKAGMNYVEVGKLFIEWKVLKLSSLNEGLTHICYVQSDFSGVSYFFQPIITFPPVIASNQRTITTFPAPIVTFYAALVPFSTEIVTNFNL